MNTTPYSPESAQSAMPAKITAGLSRTRSRLFWELELHFQFRVLRAEPSKLGPLRLGQRFLRGPFPLGLDLLHPFPYRRLTDLQLLGDLADCMASVENQRDSVPLVLIGEAPSGRTHLSVSCAQELQQSRPVSTEAGTVQTRPARCT